MKTLLARITVSTLQITCVSILAATALVVVGAVAHLIWNLLVVGWRWF